MKFHEKLYTLRKQAGMTQQDLAEKLNVSRQAVSRWEMGTAMPEIENLVAISDCLGVTLDELLREKEPEPAPPGAPAPAAPRYLDFLPGKWWIFVIAVLVLRLIPGLLAIVMLSNPGGNIWAMASWIQIINILQGAAFALLIGCFLLALIRWLKARKQ